MQARRIQVQYKHALLRGNLLRESPNVQNRWKRKGSSLGHRRASAPQQTGPSVQSLSAAQEVGAVFGGGLENGALKSLRARPSRLFLGLECESLKK